MKPRWNISIFSDDRDEAQGGFSAHVLNLTLRVGQRKWELIGEQVYSPGLPIAIFQDDFGLSPDDARRVMRAVVMTFCCDDSEVNDSEVQELVKRIDLNTWLIRWIGADFAEVGAALFATERRAVRQASQQPKALVRSAS